MSIDNKIDVRAYPITGSKGRTLAYASVAINDIAAIKNIRVVDSKKGTFVTMPQSQDKNGMYHDIAFPLSAELRREINEKVLDEFEKQSALPAGQRGYGKQEPETAGRSIDVNVEAKIFPIRKPKGETIAYASAGLDDVMVIRGIRIKDTGKGVSVTMPQAEDKAGNPYDVAFPLSAELRTKISKTILGKFRELNAEQKPGIREMLAVGKEEAERIAAAAPSPGYCAVKNSLGLGD